MGVKTFKEIIAWQLAHELVLEVYKIARNFPDYEKFSLSSQLRRCAVSIPSNIAEGSKRDTRKDQKKFYTIAFGSGAEVET